MTEPTLVLEGTSTADWQRLVQDAAAHTPHALEEPVEHYLVLLLSRTLRDAESLHGVVATEYLEGVRASGAVRTVRLREVGDRCLLLAGLFPQRARRRLVRVGYFVNMGRTAYNELADSLSRSMSELYGELARTFVPLVEVLQAMRELGGERSLSALEALELWQDTGSDRALEGLREYTGATPSLYRSDRRH
jgi:hypothetical protein